MQSYSAVLSKRPGLFTNQGIELPRTIGLTPKKWSSVDIGGPKAATIEATGSPEDLAHLLTWLGDRAEIYNEFSTPVWWGVIYEVEAVLGGVTVSVSLESVYNRVCVIYSAVGPDGSIQSAKTEWASDEDSIARYGQRDKIHSLQETTESTAILVRDRLLEELANPSPVIVTTGEGEFAATLHCQGNWEALEFIYYSNDRGLVSYDAAGGSEQVIGGFYTANTISFASQNDVHDSANGFASLAEGTNLRIAGASNSENNGDFTVDSLESNGHFEVTVNSIVNEAAGNSITISLRHGPAVSAAAQSFTLPTGWTAHKVALRIMRVGSPGDNLEIRLCADSSGSPGATLGLATIAGSNVPTEISWIELELDTPVALSSATTYWVQVGRDSGPSLSDYYVVDLDEGLGDSGGTLKVYSGSWTSRDPDADMPFRVVGQVDSIAQAVEALESSPDFLSVLPALSSDVLVDAYVDIERTILEQVEEMIALGTSTGKRLVAHVTHGRDVIIETVPENTDANPVLGRDGRLRHASGAQWQPGALIAGRYVSVESLPVLDGLIRSRGGTGVYIRESEYDADTENLMIQSEGALDPWQVIQFRKG